MGYFVNVEQGVNLYVEDINPSASKTIVFLHGWPLSHEQYLIRIGSLASFLVNLFVIPLKFMPPIVKTANSSL